MKIEWTETAVKAIREKTDGKSGLMKLKYDTDGCGCVVNGVTALWLVSTLDDDDERIETNNGPIYIEKSKAIFLDDEMKIDFVLEANSFQLKSPNQFLNPRMSFSDRT
ncbi:iron-sulfur cluster biosynthesis family protein [Peribacillus saganii]|uniref:Iron-sulfur cluster biosynthesis family protein n=1 Tax=Peribacillus saganii TaxID=2303992 RepID=A0A372L9K3_9BACI|nr:iron-sulfur cluster biosynthesis family protein [Peribacillus saganii]RFU62300.1 iron-sulfur cluster biosynthesis family protein [Peribacillus saganii]